MRNEILKLEIDLLNKEIPKLTEDLTSVRLDLLEAVRAGADNATLAAICRDFEGLEYDLSCAIYQRDTYVNELENGV